MKIFTEADVLAKLSMPAAIECLRSAFAMYGRGEAQNQPRRRLIMPTGAILHQMSAGMGPYFGTKIYSSHPRHQSWFTFLLYDAETARPLAQFEANHLGQIRTGAASGLAADVLAPQWPVTVGVIGSGFQAHSQLAAIRLVREVHSVKVWGRSQEKRERFAEQNAAVAVSSAAEACDGAHVIVTATNSKDPVVPAEAVQPDALILAMGSNKANRREVPAEIVRRADIIVDDIDQCHIEAGDLLLADIDWSTVKPLSAFAAGKTKAGHSGRLTLFKSVGIALEDVAAGAYVYEATLEPSSADRSHATR